MHFLPLLPHRLRIRRIEGLVRPYTLIGPERIRSLYNLARRIEKEDIPGDVVECGVCNGGSAAILAHFATRSRFARTVWLLDSFGGMPETSGEDGNPAKEYVGKVVGSAEHVRRILKQAGADMRCVRIVEGLFQDTFPALPISGIALLNIDADWYESVKLCLETFYDRVVLRGFVSVDDYGHWPGCRKAVDEFFEARTLSFPLHEVDYTARWFQKL